MCCANSRCFKACAKWPGSVCCVYVFLMGFVGFAGDRVMLLGCWSAAVTGLYKVGQLIVVVTGSVLHAVHVVYLTLRGAVWDGDGPGSVVCVCVCFYLGDDTACERERGSSQLQHVEAPSDLTHDPWPDVTPAMLLLRWHPHRLGSSSRVNSGSLGPSHGVLFASRRCLFDSMCQGPVFRLTNSCFMVSTTALRVLRCSGAAWTCLGCVMKVTAGEGLECRLSLYQQSCSVLCDRVVCSSCPKRTQALMWCRK